MLRDRRKMPGVSAQNAASCAHHERHRHASVAAPNGGSARDYQGLSARLAITTTDEQAGGPGRMFMQGQRWA